MAPMFLKSLLIVFLLTVCLSNAHFHQAVEVEVEVEVLPTGKGVSNDERNGVVGGRKMAVVKPEKVTASGAFGWATISSGSQRNKVKIDAECKKNNVKKFSQEVDEKEFVAFNADYRAPRHHPPKNN